MRDGWPTYFMRLAIAASSRSKCLHRQEGAVLVHGKRVVSTGYNGVPAGILDCEVCYRMTTGQDLQLCRAVHAEENAILGAALYGPSTQGTILYSTLQPCFHCAKLIIQAGIGEVYYLKPYDDIKGLELLELAGIPVRTNVFGPFDMMGDK